MGINNNERIKILAVEDDTFMQAIIKKFLSVNYDVELCPTAMDARSYIQNGNIPDLVITDLNTPNLSGLELVAQLHASEFFKSIPIIILSGEDSSETRIKCLDSGADDFIVKPFNPAEVEARIRAILRRMQKSTY